MSSEISINPLATRCENAFYSLHLSFPYQSVQNNNNILLHNILRIINQQRKIFIERLIKLFLPTFTTFNFNIYAKGLIGFLFV